MSFNDVTAAGQAFSENADIFGEAFTYDGASFVGVIDQVVREFTLADFSTRLRTVLTIVTSKPQWTAAGKIPRNRGAVTYAGKQYLIEAIAGDDTPAEPAFTLTCFKQT